MTSAPKWRWVAASVAGVSHAKSGEPCADVSRVVCVTIEGGDVLVLVAADGAGSARYGGKAAEEVCDRFCRIVCDYLRHGQSLVSIDKDVAQRFLLGLASALEEKARTETVSMSEWACTFIAALVGEHEAVFLQIGDGAIVVGDAEDYAWVFWPQSGEYVNSTHFLSDGDYLDFFQFGIVNRRIEEVAVITDGLQQLALTFVSRTVHTPFFRELFTQLRRETVEKPADIHHQLAEWLASDAVNDRTGDDKTLILATRRRD